MSLDISVAMQLTALKCCWQQKDIRTSTFSAMMDAKEILPRTDVARGRSEDNLLNYTHTRKWSCPYSITASLFIITD